jgi:AcrR family transcriptional regulator
MTRADAARNRRLLLDAAAVELSENGTDVSIAQIAARAGIGKGTVFRHFASKEDLVSAIFCDQIAGLIATGEALLATEDPGSALLEFMTAGVQLQASDRSFCQAATAISRSDQRVRAASERLAQAAEALTARARRAGAVRADVTGHDIVLLLGAAVQAAAPIGDARPDLWQRYLHLIFEGLRPQGAHEPPVAPPTSEDFEAAAGGGDDGSPRG